MLKSIRTLALISAFALPAVPAISAEITAPAQKMLDELKLGAEVFDGLDAELAVPQEWIDKAMKEDPVEIRMTVNEKLFAEMWEVFSARYPWMKYSYFHPSGAQRTTQPLMALKRQNWIVDVIASHKAVHSDFVEADLLADLSQLPAWNSTNLELNSADKLGVGVGVTPYCMGYNTNNVKKEELPKTWDELVDNPRWHNGKIGMSGNYTTWLPHLIVVKGKEWGDQFIDKLFAAKPQFRKENLQMLPKLAAMGEYDISIPSGDGQIAVNAEQGLPVAYHCPEPVPMNVTWAAVIKGSPRYYSALIFANWMISTEGQLTNYWKDKQTPNHKDLGFLAIYPDETAGKATAPMNAESLKLTAEMAEAWQAKWLAAGGPAD